MRLVMTMKSPKVLKSGQKWYRSGKVATACGFEIIIFSNRFLPSNRHAIQTLQTEELPCVWYMRYEAPRSHHPLRQQCL